MNEDEFERVTIALPTYLAEDIRAAVAAGDYPSMDAAMATAIGDWWADRAITRIGAQRLRRHLDESVAEGGFHRLDVEDVLARVSERAASLRRNAGTLAG